MAGAQGSSPTKKEDCFEAVYRNEQLCNYKGVIICTAMPRRESLIVAAARNDRPGRT